MIDTAFIRSIREGLKQSRKPKETGTDELSQEYKEMTPGQTDEALDPVNKDAVKKKFKDRKDKDIDNDGDTDLMCSSFDQWTRINGDLTPHAEPVPIFYRNENGKLKGQFFENEVLNKNKWFIPVRHKDINRMAQVEPFSCDEMYVEVSEIVN